MMTSFVGRVGQSVAYTTGFVLAVEPAMQPQPDRLDWLLKVVLGVLLAVVGYFLKQTGDDLKSSKGQLAKHSEILAAHAVMFEVWLDEIVQSDEEPHPTRRQTDQLKLLIGKLAKEKQR